MDPEDKIHVNDLTTGNIVKWTDYVYDADAPGGGDYDSSNAGTINTAAWNITFSSVSANDNDFNIVLDDFSDTTFSITPVENEPAVYTSHEQREQHDKYPALQKMWEDYLTMFALTKGEPPIVE